MSALSEYAKRQAIYVRIAPGEEIQVTYQGSKVIPNKFDPEKEVVQYQFLVDGTKKFWESASGKAATFFDTCVDGDIVSIKNVGKEKAPRYEFNKIIEAPRNAKPAASVTPVVQEEKAPAVVVG